MISTGCRNSVTGPKFVWLVAFLAPLACSRSSKDTQPPAKERGVIVLKCAVRDAVVWLDEVRQGRIVDVLDGISVEARLHRIQVRHERFHTFYREVAVENRGRVVVSVELAEVFP